MTHWFEVFRYELRQAFRRKAYLFMTFGVPLLALVAFYGYQFYQDQTSGDAQDTPVAPVTQTNNSGSGTVFGYVDRTPEALFPAPESYPEVDCAPTDEEVRALNASDNVPSLRQSMIKRISSPYCLKNSMIYFETFDAGKNALEDGDIDILAVIEPDYVEGGDISIYVEQIAIESMESQSTFEDYLIRSLVYNVDAADYESLYLRLRDPAYITTQHLDQTGEAEITNEDQNLILVYAFGLLSMLGIFWGGGYLMQSVVQEKESRIVEIIMSSVQPTALLAGKVLAQGMAALLQITLLVGTFVFIGTQAGDISSSIGDLDIRAGTIVVLAVYFVLGFLQFGSLMAAVGAMSTTVREAQNFVAVITLPAALPFFFLTVFVEEPNGTLPRALSLFPLTAPLSMIMRRAIVDVPLGEIALSIALMLIGIAAAVWIAGRLFRVNILLSGSMPKFKDIPKLLRG